MSAVAVVLLHPLGVDHRFWAPVVDALPAEMGPVVAPDLLGHGRAPLPQSGANVEQFADAVVAALSGHERVQLVGVSLGGLVAQVIANRHPGLVDRLVLADTVAVYPAPMQTMWRERSATVREHGLATVADSMPELWFTEAFRQRCPDQVAAVREALLAMDPEGYARTCEALATADTTVLVAGIRVPLLVACGHADAPPFLEATKWFETTVPGARTAWLSGAHATAYECPGEFAELLVDFLG